MYYYEGMPTREPKILSIEKISVTTKSHPTVIEFHSDTELHTDVKHHSNNAKL